MTLGSDGATSMAPMDENGRNRVEDGKPRFSRARRFPDAAGRRAGVEHSRLSNDARHGGDPSPAEWTDVAPNQWGKETCIKGPRSRCRGLRSERSNRERDGAEHEQGWWAHYLSPTRETVQCIAPAARALPPIM